MGKVIVYCRAGKPASVVYPAPEYLAKFETEDEALQALAEKVVPDGLEWGTVDASTVPADRSERAGWCLSFGSAKAVGGANEKEDGVFTVDKVAAAGAKAQTFESKVAAAETLEELKALISGQ